MKKINIPVILIFLIFITVGCVGTTDTMDESYNLTEVISDSSVDNQHLLNIPEQPTQSGEEECDNYVGDLISETPPETYEKKFDFCASVPGNGSETPPETSEKELREHNGTLGDMEIRECIEDGLEDFLIEWDIRVHHSPTEESSVDEWISVAFYWEGSINVCIPSTWYAIEYIEGYYTPDSYLTIFGEGINGTIRLYSSVSPIGNPYYVIREFSYRERFYFDNGQEGYMLENPGGILWLQSGTSIGISLWYGDRREVFNDNKDIILQIVRTLR